jgi:hypothetical protein
VTNTISAPNAIAPTAPASIDETTETWPRKPPGPDST